MKSSRCFLRVRRDIAGVEETFQVVPALTVAIVCVAAVMAAAGSASQAASAAAAKDRASLQAEVLLDALRESPVLRGHGGAISLERAQMVAKGNLSLKFQPSATRVISLTWFPDGTELFLVGNTSRLGEGLLVRAQPVPVELTGGDTQPGLLRVGVQV